MKPICAASAAVMTACQRRSDKTKKRNVNATVVAPPPHNSIQITAGTSLKAASRRARRLSLRVSNCEG